ncbi:hypothetical protein DFQ28_009381 [Apophysomyces sp. BC1034]|nr:hypothetical protein DFQ28_009381 [Apophysomyces sp. BC1034]
MYANILARSALRSRANARQLARSDLYHFENGHGKNFPFDTKNRTAFTIKYVAFTTLGFVFPFIGCAWQLNKN